MSPADNPEPSYAGHDTGPPYAGPAGAPLLQVTGLRKAFGDHEVLRSIDLEVRRGQVLALVGPSGSGKTTVLRSLNTLEVPDGGRIQVRASAGLGAGTTSTEPELTVDFDHRPGRRQFDALLAQLRDRSAMVFQHYNLFPHKTVLQNVIEGPVQVRGRPRAEAVAEADRLLARVGLAGRNDSYPHQLSGGQQQRVGIVRALAMRPQVLLFDEPTSALDPELVGDVLGVIRELSREGWTMVLVTHELAFARDVADEVVFIDGGVVVERGPAARVLTSPEQERTRQFVRRLQQR